VSSVNKNAAFVALRPGTSEATCNCFVTSPPCSHPPPVAAAFSREKTGACPFKCRTSYCPHVPTQGPGCERRSCSEQAAASVACVMLQGLVTLSATTAIQNACCVSVLMRVLRSRRLSLSTKSLSRGVCKAGGSCWNQDVDAALRNAGSEGTPKVGCVVCSCGCFGLRVLGCSAGAWSDWSACVLGVMLKNSQVAQGIMYSRSQQKL
jgi:hypothetical protein